MSLRPTLSEARAQYEGARTRLNVVLAQYDTVQESLDAALAEDSPEEVIRLEALLDDVRYSIEDAGNDLIFKGEILDGIEEVAR